MTNNHVLSVKKGLEDIRNHMSNARVYVNFEKCIKCFAGGAYCDQDANLLDFFKSIAEDPEGFKDRSNFPPTWKSDNSIIAGVSSISQAADTPSIKKALEPDVFTTVKQNLLAYMHALKGVPETAGEETVISEVTHDEASEPVPEPPVAVVETVAKRRGRPPKSASTSLPVAPPVKKDKEEKKTDKAEKGKAVSKSKAADRVVVVHKHDVNGGCCSAEHGHGSEDAGDEEGSGSGSDQSDGSQGEDFGDARARSDADVLETLFLMLNEARNVIAEKNKTIQRLVHECRELKQIGTDAGLRRELDLTKKRLEICTTYIQKTAVEKDPAMLDAFMTLLQMNAYGVEV